MNNNRSCPQVGDYVLLMTLGSGSTGKVKLAENKNTCKKVAIKIIKKSTVEQQPDLAIKIRREISLMKLFDHPHLLKLYDVMESQAHLYIILEFAEHGELFDYLVESGSLSIDEALKFFRQIIFGLEFLHNHAICHRDLKPENILLDEHDNIKIADFGLARWMKSNTVDTSCGSPHYASPEVIKGEPYDGRKSDIWSAGVVFYTLLCGRLPFEDNSIRNLLLKVKSGQFRMPDFPPDIKDLISRMLTVDPNKRISLAEIKEHPAFRQGIPQFYTFPSPLPLPSIKNPIDISQVDEDTINVLRQLGFDEDNSELSKELKSNEHSMAKVFVYMLTNRQSLDNLPWAKKEIEENVDTDGNSNNNGYENVGLNLGFSSDNQSPELIYPADVTPMISSLQLNNYDQFHRMKDNRRGIDSVSSPEHYSIIERSFFSEDAPIMICNATREIKGIMVPLENLFTAIQIWLPKQGFAWFYPDETKIIARKRSDQLDVIMQSTIDIDNSLTLMVSLPKGNQDLFNVFVEELQTLINGIVPE